MPVYSYDHIHLCTRDPMAIDAAHTELTQRGAVFTVAPRTIDPASALLLCRPPTMS